MAAALQHHISSSTAAASRGRAIHSLLIKSGIHPNTNILIKLLILHLRCGCLLYAHKVFDEIPHPTLSAYNFLIAARMRQKANASAESLALVRQMAFSNVVPDGFTLSMALKISVASCSLDLVMQIHAQITKSSNDPPDDVLIASLVDSYVKNGGLIYARRIFDRMPAENLYASTALIVGYMNQASFAEAESVFRDIMEKDTVVFNAMIEGYSKKQETCLRSIQVYKDMRGSGLCPSVSTFVSAMGACCLLSALELAQQLHGQIVKEGLDCNVKSGSALLDMYAKFGRVGDAQRVFEHMPEKNTVSWTSLIDGYGKNGRPNEALLLFFEMRRRADVKPNHATFLSALSACGHAGLLSSGKEIFESMERDFALIPRMEHYACMVDLLARMGNLDEAYAFVKQMKEEPNTDVWTALLAASEQHGNVEMANIAANEVFKLNKDGRPGAYMALSNTFAAAGRWQRVRVVRELMIQRGVLKDTGSSWVGTDEGLTGIPC